jgi:hypothetical protein
VEHYILIADYETEFSDDLQVVQGWTRWDNSAVIGSLEKNKFCEEVMTYFHLI